MIDEKKGFGDRGGSRWLLVGAIIVVLFFVWQNLSPGQKAGQTEEKGKVGEAVLAEAQSIEPGEYDALASRADVFVVDVHVPEQKHLPNTDAFIPFDQIGVSASELPEDKTTPILVYCRSGGMSRQASRELINMGYEAVYDLEGGKDAYDATLASVELTPKTIDLGTVIYGEVGRAQFELKNNSTQAVEIERVSTSCSCTKAEIAETLLAPQTSAMVDVSFDPAVHKDDQDLGDVTRTIFIETNHPQAKELTASISAVVVKK